MTRRNRAGRKSGDRISGCDEIKFVQSSLTEAMGLPNTGLENYRLL